MKIRKLTESEHRFPRTSLHYSQATFDKAYDFLERATNNFTKEGRVELDAGINGYAAEDILSNYYEISGLTGDSENPTYPEEVRFHRPISSNKISESADESYKKGDRVYLIDTDETGTVAKDFDWQNEDRVAVEIDGMGKMKYVLSTQLRDLQESKELKTFGAKAKKLNEIVEPQKNGYHNIWPINDRIIVHNDGGVYHVVQKDGWKNTYIYSTESIDDLNQYLQSNFDETIVDPEPKEKPVEEPKKRYPLYMWKMIEDAVSGMDNIPEEHKEQFISLVGDKATTKKIPGVGYKSSLLPAKLRAKYGDRANYNSLIVHSDSYDITLEQALTDIYDVMKSRWFSESLSEDYKVKFFQVFEAPKSPKENGKMIGQRGTLDDANAFGKEKVGEGKYIIKAVCDDGKIRPIDNDTKASDYRMVESIEVATIADYIVDHYDFDDIEDKYSCINSIRDSFKGQETISEEELEQFIGAHNGKDKVNESFNDGWTQRFAGMNVFTNGDYQIKSVILSSGEDGWELGTWNNGKYRRIDVFKDIDKAKKKAYDLKHPLGESIQEDGYAAQRYLEYEIPDICEHVATLIDNCTQDELTIIIKSARSFYANLEFIASKHSDIVRESLDEALFEDVEVETKAGPEEGPEFGLSSLLNQAIQDEFKTIDMYNSIALTAKEEGFEDIVSVIDEINTEENKHVGQLQEILKTVSPNAEAIDAGEIEGSEQIGTPITESIGGIDDNSITLTGSVFYDLEQNLIDNGWTDILNFFKSKGWVNDGKVIIPEGTQLTKEDTGSYWTYYSINNSGMIIPFTQDSILELINNSNSSPNNINEGDADMTDRAKEIYNSFKDIEKELNGDGEAITAVIDKLYDDNREDSDYQSAYRHWADGE